MVDVVNRTHALAEINKITDGSIYIVKNDVLGNKLLGARLYHFLQLLLVGSAFENFFKNAEAYLFVYAVFCGVKIHIGSHIHHAVSYYLHFPLFNAVSGLACGSGIGLLVLYREPCLAYARLFDLTRLFIGDELSLVGDYFSGKRISNGSGQIVSGYTRTDTQLLIIFVTSETCKIVTLCVEEKTVEVILSAFHRRWFARAELFINFKESFLTVLCGILLEDSLVEPFVRTEKLLYLNVRSAAEGTDKGGKRDLPVFVYADICNVVGIHFVFKPRAPVGDNGSLEEILACLILFKSVVNAGGTNELRNDNALRAVDNESSAVGHKREIAHEYFVFLNDACFLVPERSLYSQWSGVGNVPLLALRNGIFRCVVDRVIHKVQHQIAVIVGNSRNIAENLFKSFIQKPLV